MRQFVLLAHDATKSFQYFLAIPLKTRRTTTSNLFRPPLLSSIRSCPNTMYYITYTIYDISCMRCTLLEIVLWNMCTRWSGDKLWCFPLRSVATMRKKRHQGRRAAGKMGGHYIEWFQRWNANTQFDEKWFDGLNFAFVESVHSISGISQLQTGRSSWTWCSCLSTSGLGCT